MALDIANLRVTIDGDASSAIAAAEAAQSSFEETSAAAQAMAQDVLEAFQQVSAAMQGASSASAYAIDSMSQGAAEAAQSVAGLSASVDQVTASYERLAAAQAQANASSAASAGAAGLDEQTAAYEQATAAAQRYAEAQSAGRTAAADAGAAATGIDAQAAAYDRATAAAERYAGVSADANAVQVGFGVSAETVTQLGLFDAGVQQYTADAALAAEADDTWAQTLADIAAAQAEAASATAAATAAEQAQVVALAEVATGATQASAAQRDVNAAILGTADAETAQAASSDYVSNRFNLMGAAVVLAAGGIALYGANFDAAMNKSQTLAGASADEVQRLSGSVLQLAASTGDSPTQLAAGLYKVESAGISGADALNVLTVAAQEAAAAQTDAAPVADILTSALNAYHQPASQAAADMDILQMTVRDGKQEFSDLADNLGRVLPIAAQMGIGLDQVGAAEATMTEKGLSAGEATTALRGFIQALEMPTSQTRKELADLGLTADDVRALIADKGLLPAMAQLVQMTGGNDDALKALIPNVRALSGALADVGTTGSDYARILADTQNATNASAQAWDSWSQTSKASMERFKGAFLADVAEVGQSADQALAPVIGDATNVAASFAQLESSNAIVRDFTGGLVVLGGSAAAIGLLAQAGQLLGKAFEPLGDIFSSAWSGLQKLNDLLTPASTGTATLATSASAAATAQTAEATSATAVATSEGAAATAETAAALADGALATSAGTAAAAQTAENAAVTANPIAALIGSGGIGSLGALAGGAGEAGAGLAGLPLAAGGAGISGIAGLGALLGPAGLLLLAGGAVGYGLYSQNQQNGQLPPADRNAYQVAAYQQGVTDQKFAQNNPDLAAQVANQQTVVENLQSRLQLAQQQVQQLSPAQNDKNQGVQGGSVSSAPFTQDQQIAFQNAQQEVDQIQGQLKTAQSDLTKYQADYAAAVQQNAVDQSIALRNIGRNAPDFNDQTNSFTRPQQFPTTDTTGGSILGQAFQGGISRAVEGAQDFNAALSNATTTMQAQTPASAALQLQIQQLTDKYNQEKITLDGLTPGTAAYKQAQADLNTTAGQVQGLLDQRNAIQQNAQALTNDLALFQQGLITYPQFAAAVNGSTTATDAQKQALLSAGDAIQQHSLAMQANAQITTTNADGQPALISGIDGVSAAAKAAVPSFEQMGGGAEDAQRVVSTAVATAQTDTTNATGQMKTDLAGVGATTPDLGSYTGSLIASATSAAYQAKAAIEAQLQNIAATATVTIQTNGIVQTNSSGGGYFTPDISRPTVAPVPPGAGGGGGSFSPSGAVEGDLLGAQEASYLGLDDRAGASGGLDLSASVDARTPKPFTVPFKPGTPHLPSGGGSHSSGSGVVESARALARQAAAAFKAELKSDVSGMSDDLQDALASFDQIVHPGGKNALVQDLITDLGSDASQQQMSQAVNVLVEGAFSSGSGAASADAAINAWWARVSKGVTDPAQLATLQTEYNNAIDALAQATPYLAGAQASLDRITAGNSAITDALDPNSVTAQANQLLAAAQAGSDPTAIIDALFGTSDGKLTPQQAALIPKIFTQAEKDLFNSIDWSDPNAAANYAQGLANLAQAQSAVLPNVTVEGKQSTAATQAGQAATAAQQAASGGTQTKGGQNVTALGNQVAAAVLAGDDATAQRLLLSDPLEIAAVEKVAASVIQQTSGDANATVASLNKLTSDITAVTPTLQSNAANIDASATSNATNAFQYAKSSGKPLADLSGMARQAANAIEAGDNATAVRLIVSAGDRGEELISAIGSDIDNDIAAGKQMVANAQQQLVAAANSAGAQDYGIAQAGKSPTGSNANNQAILAFQGAQNQYGVDQATLATLNASLANINASLATAVPGSTDFQLLTAAQQQTIGEIHDQTGVLNTDLLQINSTAGKAAEASNANLAALQKEFSHLPGTPGASGGGGGGVASHSGLTFEEVQMVNRLNPVIPAAWIAALNPIIDPLAKIADNTGQMARNTQQILDNQGDAAIYLDGGRIASLVGSALVGRVTLLAPAGA